MEALELGRYCRRVKRTQMRWQSWGRAMAERQSARCRMHMLDKRADTMLVLAAKAGLPVHPGNAA